MIVNDTLAKSFATAWNTGSELQKVCIILILAPLTHTAEIGVMSLQVHIGNSFAKDGYSILVQMYICCANIDFTLVVTDMFM